MSKLCSIEGSVIFGKIYNDNSAADLTVVKDELVFK